MGGKMSTPKAKGFAASTAHPPIQVVQKKGKNNGRNFTAANPVSADSRLTNLNPVVIRNDAGKSNPTHGVQGDVSKPQPISSSLSPSLSSSIKNAVLDYSTIGLIETSGFESGHTPFLSIPRLARFDVSRNGKLVLSSTVGNTVCCLWDCQTGQKLKTFEGHSEPVYSLTFSSDGNRALSGSWDCTVRIWDCKTGKELQCFKKHSQVIWCQVFSHDGRWALSASSDKTIRLWNCQNGQERFCFQGHGSYVFSVAFSPDGNRAVSGSNDKTVRIWDCNTGLELQCFKGHGESVRSVAFSPDGNRVLSGSWDYTVRIWDCKTGQELQCFKGHKRQVNSVAFSPDGNRVLSESWDNTVRIWDCKTGLELQCFNWDAGTLSDVDFSLDGKWVFAASDHGVHIWNSQTGSCISRSRNTALESSETKLHQPSDTGQNGTSTIATPSTATTTKVTNLPTTSEALTPSASASGTVAVPTHASQGVSFVGTRPVTSLADIAERVQKTFSDEQELAIELNQQVVADSETLPSQTAAESLVQDLKQKLEAFLEVNRQQRDQQKLQIAKLKTQLDQVTETAAHKDLEKRISNLENSQALLVADYNTRQAIFAKQEYILKQQELARFYRTAQNKLQQIFLAYKVLGSGMVESTALTGIDKTVCAISLAGDLIPLPGARLAAKMFAGAIKLADWVAKEKQGANNANKISNINELLVSFKELDELIETTSRILTLMYEEQLKCVTPESAGILAEAAVKLMVAFLWAGQHQEGKTLCEELVASVAYICPQNNPQGFLQQLGQRFSEYADKFKDNNITTRQPGERWTAFGVFQRPGLLISTNNEIQYFSGGTTQPAIYGYRLGTMEEATAAGLQQTDRIDSHELVLNQSGQKQIVNLSQNTKAVQDKTERLAAQFLMEHTERIKLAEDVAAMKLAMANPSAAFRATEDIQSMIFITGSTFNIARSKIAAEKLAGVDTILGSYAENNCSEEDVKYNRSGQITELTVSPALVSDLKKELMVILAVK